MVEREMVKKYLHLATAKVRRDFVNYSPLDRATGAIFTAEQGASEDNKKPP